MPVQPIGAHQHLRGWFSNGDLLVSYQFTDSVPYLLNWVGVRLGERFSVRLTSYDITLPMYRVLATLRQQESKTLTELSDMVSVEISTLSRLVGLMVRRNLVSRERPADNARIVCITLTTKGEELADELMPIAAMFEKTAIEGLDPGEVKLFKSILRHIGLNIAGL
ncbi:hypothetical protein SRABI05_04573 [Agrobacterium fabrum]|nr:MarR family transcriptional regulator [Agrobacterium fabrum]CAH0300174.1 hypothetical protein SRABI46_04621 [Agrobacterium fabrum]CAH0305535.1 hypothetical protein SRABI05_04573 [Agrobacterium fabrum]